MAEPIDVKAMQRKHSACQGCFVEDHGSHCNECGADVHWPCDAALLADALEAIEKELLRRAMEAEDRRLLTEGELRCVRDERRVTVAHAIDVLLADADAVENFRTHRVERGSESWEFTIRRADGKTPSEIIDALRAKLAAAERVVAEARGVAAATHRTNHGWFAPTNAIESLRAALAAREGR